MVAPKTLQTYPKILIEGLFTLKIPLGPSPLPNASSPESWKTLISGPPHQLSINTCIFHDKQTFLDPYSLSETNLEDSNPILPFGTYLIEKPSQNTNTTYYIHLHVSLFYEWTILINLDIGGSAWGRFLRVF